MHHLKYETLCYIFFYIVHNIYIFPVMYNSFTSFSELFILENVTYKIFTFTSFYLYKKLMHTYTYIFYM